MNACDIDNPVLSDTHMMQSFADAFNAVIQTDDGSLIGADTPLLCKIVNSIVAYNTTSHVKILMEAYAARFLLSSGEKVYASIVENRLKKKDAYSTVRYVLLEIMLSVTVATLVYVLSKTGHRD